MSIVKQENPNISHILGMDYGRSKVGLAMADSETRMAFGYGTLKNDKNFFRKLGEIVAKEGISKIIIGIQAEAEPSEGRAVSKLSGEIEKTAKHLQNTLNISVEFQSEAYTTQQAHRNLIEKGAKGIKRFDDREAARLILQGWLDKRK